MLALHPRVVDVIWEAVGPLILWVPEMRPGTLTCGFV
jgi:hypothetical protein